MALVIGNKTASLTTPGATTITVSHTQNVGSNGYLFLVLQMANVVTVTGITYGGVAMTLQANVLPTTYSSTWQIWKLAAPATGANNVVVTMSAAQYNPVSLYVVSATGSNGIGNVAFDNTSTSPNSTSLTVSANSVILGGYLSGTSTGSTITIDGSSRTVEFNHNINNYTGLGFSATGLTDGAKTVQVAASTDVAGNFFEILEGGGGGGSGINQGNFIPLF